MLLGCTRQVAGGRRYGSHDLEKPVHAQIHMPILKHTRVPAQASYGSFIDMSIGQGGTPK